MLSLNEIRSRALAFSREYADEFSEDAEAKSFWDDFFRVFGVPRRRVASFEKSVERNDGSKGFIDLLWKGTLLIEHKSRGKSLDRAYNQATEYFHGLKNRDLPRYVLVCDFQRFRLYDLDEGKQAEFTLNELPQNIHLFGFISGYVRRDFGKEDPANIMAAEKMGELHDKLKADGYDGHELELMLVRLLFCLFAEDTGIFEASSFREYVDTRTSEDGFDLGYHLAMLFDVLNTPVTFRQKSLDEQMTSFPYVNGKLFEERLRTASFNADMRETLLNCCALDWSRISPAIFGSLFQSVMDAQARRNLGAHYTQELNILKVLKPLFLDSLNIELGQIKNSRNKREEKLRDFIKKLSEIRIFDPACGCGNFLVVAYRELRQLELEALRTLYPIGKRQTTLTGAKAFSSVNVDQCYGIEIEEFPAQIAKVALWLTDHQMNMALSSAFGEYYVRLPLVKSAKIVHGNALKIDWQDVVSPAQTNYIVGNPPFIGSKMMSGDQRKEMAHIFFGIHGAKVLDYVAAWYLKATEFMQQNPKIHTAFVSTNSICQGEQVSILWGELLQRGCSIFFAHRTFQWSSEARRRAAVHCVIIGFCLETITSKILFDYQSPLSEPEISPVTEITPYLTTGETVLVTRRSRPLCDVPSLRFGNMPLDGGHLLLSDEDKEELLRKEPQAEKFIRSFMGAEEFLNGKSRWCLWLVDAQPQELRGMPEVLQRIQKVKEFRLASIAPSTRVHAATPSVFRDRNQPASQYLIVPKVSSERRAFIPIGFLAPDIVSSDLNFIIENVSLFHFGILSSTMHMAWMRYVGGRLESRYRYSKDIVYNNFPWPDAPKQAKINAIEKAAQAVLDARAQFPNSTLADLYDPNTMPLVLIKAHTQLDKAVDSAYGCKSGIPELERMSFLFGMYKNLIRQN